MSHLNIFSLAGETAVITGGGTGIGLGIARCFVRAGARVVLVGRREAPLQQAAAELGPLAEYTRFDITQLDQAQDFIDKLTERVGPLSILVNNAGIHIKKTAVSTTDADFQVMLQTHVLGAFALTRSVLPQMLARKAGNIIFMASMTSFIGMPYTVTYSAAKSAYLGMVHTLSTELAPQGVRVNGIAPGWIESDMLHRALDNDPPRKQKIMSRIAMDHFGQPEDIGWTAVYLCSQAGKYITGTVIPVDGGALHGF